MMIGEIYINMAEVSLIKGRKGEIQFDRIVEIHFKNGKDLMMGLTNKEWSDLKEILKDQPAK